LDDLAFYNGHLSAAEVKAIYDDSGPFDPSVDSRLALHYNFNDPSSNTVLNQAPSTSGLYPLILGSDKFSAQAMSAADYVDDSCSAVSFAPPVYVCHTYETCSGIPSPSQAPVAFPDPLGLVCVVDNAVAFSVYPFAFDPDGNELTFQVRTLPQHGFLYEEVNVEQEKTTRSEPQSMFKY